MNTAAMLQHTYCWIFVSQVCVKGAVCWCLDLLCSSTHTSSLPCGCRQHEAVTSAILVGSQVIRHAPAAAQGQLWGPFVAAAWPWTMWHHHAIRSAHPFIPHFAGSPATAMHTSSCHFLPTFMLCLLPLFESSAEADIMYSP